MESKENAFRNNIQIKNFGPIKEADIEIAPLTVFVGPNSSGKSFTAKLTNILFNSYHIIYNYNDDEGIKHLFDFTKISLNSFRENHEETYQKFSDLLWNYLQSEPSFDSEPLVIPSNIICSILNDGILKEYVNFTKYSLQNSFFHDLDKLIRYSKDEFEIIFNGIHFKYKSSNLKLNEFYPFGEIFNNLNMDEEMLLNFDDNNNLLVNINYMLVSNYFKNKDVLTNFMYSLIGVHIYEIISSEKSFYIPAERSMGGNFQNHISKLLENKDAHNSDKELTNNLLSIDYDKKGDFYELGNEFEQSILGGSLKFNSKDNDELDEDVSKYVFTLPSPLLSTSCQQLSVFFVHLKYLVRKGDTLIIEEPEAHIHPANQRILVKYLVRAVNEGLNIIITTHSDYIIEQLNNLIRLGNTSEDTVKDLKYSKKDILNHEDINIYHFEEDPDEKYAFIPKCMDINFTGFTDENFSEVVDSLYEESDKIIRAKLR